MNIFNRKNKPVITPESILLAEHPEFADRIVGTRQSHLDSHYFYVFIDTPELPDYVVRVDNGTVEPIHDGESARVCLMRALKLVPVTV